MADGEYLGTITKILAIYGMKTKFLAVSSDQYPAVPMGLEG